VSDKPIPPALNLDTLDVEGAPDPFVFVLDGKRFEVGDLEGHDWQDLMDFDATDAEGTLRLMLGKQYDDFRAVRGVSMRKIRVLLDSLRDHFGLATPPETDASPGS
jgi:hypothetical protein